MIIHKIYGFNKTGAVFYLVTALILAFGFSIPLYSDEIAIFMTKGSFFQEDFRLLTLIPQCIPSITLKMPIGWYPGAIFYSFLYYIKSALYIRILSLFIAISFFGFYMALVKHALWSDEAKYQYLNFSALILFLGTLPAALILSRPEQILILALTSLAFLVQHQKFNLTSNYFGIIKLLILIFIVSIIFYTHPKGLFFLPFLLACGFYFFYKYSKALFLIAIFSMLFMAYDSVIGYQSIFNCEAAPQLSKLFAVQTTNLGLLKSNFNDFIVQIKYNLLQAPSLASDGFMRHIIFGEKFQSNWLAPTNYNLPYILNITNQIIYYYLKILVWFSILIPPTIVTCEFLWGLRRGSFKVNLLALGLWLGLISHISLNRVWNFYTPIFPIAISLLLILITFYKIRINLFKNKIYFSIIRKVTIILLFIFSFLSVSILYFSVLPLTQNNTFYHQYNSEIQSLSTPFFGLSKGKNSAVELYKNCGLIDEGRLVVDNLTYFYFSGRKILHIDYLDPGSFGVDVSQNSLIPMLKKIGATGVFVQCNHLPDIMRESAIRSENFCCLNLNR